MNKKFKLFLVWLIEAVEWLISIGKIVVQVVLVAGMFFGTFALIAAFIGIAVYIGAQYSLWHAAGAAFVAWTVVMSVLNKGSSR